MEVVGLDEVVLLHISHKDEYLYEKLVDLLEESGYQVNHLQSRDSKAELFQFKELVIIPERHQVFLNEQEVELTGKEFQILMLLARNRGRVFSKEQIYDIVWEEPYSGDYNIVMTHIHNIREKIEDNPSKPVYIQTVWGVGYRFNKNLSSGL